MRACITNSFEKVNYLLRPSKQIERKIFIETLLRLTEVGYSISSYEYVGFGSVFYADFILLHKYCHIAKMTCVEWGDIPKRMRFNKPYKFIKLRMMPFADYAQQLRKTDKYIVWLDYDRPVDKDMLADVSSCLTRLGEGSILIITADAEPRIPEELWQPQRTVQQLERKLLRQFRNDFARLIDDEISADALSSAGLANLYSKVFRSQIERSFTSRLGERFIQLFNFRYRDGAQMITLGGIVGTEQTLPRLERTPLFRSPFIERGAEPREISVPPLTLREKQWLDSRLDDRLAAHDLQFELEDQHFANYRRYYKHYPVYHESIA